MPCLAHHGVQARLREMEQERGDLLSHQHLLEEKLEASKLQVRSSGVLPGLWYSEALGLFFVIAPTVAAQ